MFIDFFCSCPQGLPIKLNFNISKVACWEKTNRVLNANSYGKIVFLRYEILIDVLPLAV